MWRSEVINSELNFSLTRKVIIFFDDFFNAF